MMQAVMREREFTPEHRARIRAALQKLTDEQVRAIRRRLADGAMQRDVAAEFGIHQGSVSNIARRKTYTHVSED